MWTQLIYIQQKGAIANENGTQCWMKAMKILLAI